MDFITLFVLCSITHYVATRLSFLLVKSVKTTERRFDFTVDDCTFCGRRIQVCKTDFRPSIGRKKHIHKMIGRVNARRNSKTLFYAKQIM
jgi:hypothetical protein